MRTRFLYKIFTFQEALLSFGLEATLACCHVIMFKVVNVIDRVVKKPEKPLGHALHINQTPGILRSFHFLKILQNSEASRGGQEGSSLWKCRAGGPHLYIPHVYHSGIHYLSVKHCTRACCAPRWLFLNVVTSEVNGYLFY